MKTLKQLKDQKIIALTTGAWSNLAQKQLDFNTGQLINIHSTKRYKYSQDAFKVVLTNFDVKRR